MSVQGHVSQVSPITAASRSPEGVSQSAPAPISNMAPMAATTSIRGPDKRATGLASRPVSSPAPTPRAAA
ncbi:hypothetical protein RZS08_25540 [Arthrospira platensis SPKY1]|nr:hypothetical protein [Arthrospira platensis SPKY1]